MNQKVAYKRAHPKTRNEEVVSEDGDRKDIYELPAKQTVVQQPGRLDQAFVHASFYANGNDSKDDQA